MGNVQHITNNAMSKTRGFIELCHSLLDNSHVLVFGGGRAPGILNDVMLTHFEAIQTSGAKCKDHGIPDLPVSAYEGAMVSMEGKIFFMGGKENYSSPIIHGKNLFSVVNCAKIMKYFPLLVNSEDNLRAVDLLQAKPWSWMDMSPMPSSRFTFSAVTDDLDIIYAFGGRETPSLLRDTIFKYSAAGNSWSTLAATLSTPAQTLSVKVANNMVWVGHSLPTGATGTIKLFDMNSESMTNDIVPALPTGKTSQIT